MKKTTYFIFVTALLVCSCTDEFSQPDKTPGLIGYSFSAGATPGLRSSYYGEESLIWNMGDEISVLDGYGNRLFHTADEGEKAIFSGSISSAATDFIAIYPYDEENKLESDGNAVAVFPYFQNVVQGGFCAGANPSLGIGKVDGSETVEMHNLGSYLKFTIPEGGSVSAIFLKSNGGESLSGPLSVNYSSEEPVSSSSGGLNYVSLVPRDSYAFTPGTYYAVVNPVTLSSGISVIARRPDGKTGVKKGSSGNTLLRNKTKDLGTIDLEAMDWKEDALYANDTITLDFRKQPFVENIKTGKDNRDSGIVEYHTPRGDCFVFRVDTNGTVKNTRGGGWNLSKSSNGYLNFQPHTSASRKGDGIIDGIQCPAVADRRLKKVMLTTGSASFKAVVYTMDGDPVTGGMDTDSTHFKENGNWKAGITAEFELTGTAQGTSYNIISVANSSFIAISKLVFIYEKTQL